MIVSQNEKSTTIAMPIEPQYFGMFTDEGNHAVAFIVVFAKTNGAEWENVLPMLGNLAASDRAKYGEALDTVVREMVYDACCFTSDFYV
jgi:hypothetical protein